MPDIELHTEIDIARPAAEVWAIITDYTRDPEWRTKVRSMVPDPPGVLRVGSTTVEVMRLGGRTMRNEGEVTEIDEGTSFAWRTTSGADADGRRTVTQVAPDRCRVRLELRARPHGAELLVVPALRRVVRRTLSAEAEGLRRLAESGDRTVGADRS